jgi:hypothetical protein
MKVDIFMRLLLYSRRNPLDRRLFTAEAVPERTTKKTATGNSLLQPLAYSL